MAENNQPTPESSGRLSESAVVPFRAHHYPEIVKAAESCVPEPIIPEPPEPEPELTDLRSIRRRAWINGRGCTRCGSKRKLEVDHIDPSTKVIPANRAFSLSPDNPKAIKELAKCQVLCQRCHQRKTAREMGWR